MIYKLNECKILPDWSNSAKLVGYYNGIEVRIVNCHLTVPPIFLGIICPCLFVTIIYWRNGLCHYDNAYLQKLSGNSYRMITRRDIF